MSSRDSTTVTVYLVPNSLLTELRLRDQIRSAVIEFYWVPTIVTSLASFSWTTDCRSVTSKSWLIKLHWLLTWHLIKPGFSSSLVVVLWTHHAGSCLHRLLICDDIKQTPAFTGCRSVNTTHADSSLHLAAVLWTHHAGSYVMCVHRTANRLGSDYAWLRKQQRQPSEMYLLQSSVNGFH